MLAPAHCSKRLIVVALAVPGAIKAATEAAETTHADTKRRAEKDVIT
jgi:RNase P/RNase MRP subunit POP5